MFEPHMRAVLVALVQIAAFAVFVAFCAAIPRAADWDQKRRRILFLAGYLVIVHLAIGVSQKDAWPLTNYRLMHGLVNPGSEEWRMGAFGVDGSGREWRVDPYAWRSISDWHLQFWFLREFDRATPAQRASVLRLLYRLAEENRAFVQARGRLPQPSILGPLTAPQWWMFDRESAVPHESYRKIRVYKEVWVWKDKLDTGHVGERKLLGEWAAQ